MFLRYVHNFRAVAIVIIVAGHAIVTLDWPTVSPTRDFVLDLLDNGTVLFVFVAGFLFHHLSGRYRYRDYLAKKLTNVILPYLLIMAPAVAYTVLYTDVGATTPELAGLHPLAQGGWMFLHGSGTFNYPLWFVPMISLFYLAAPVFIRVVQLPRLYLVLVVLVPLSMLAHRSSESDTLTIALYFLPAYILGMWASQYRARIEPLLDRRWVPLAAAYLVAVVAAFLFDDWHGNYYGAAPFSQEHGPVDWLFAQKLFLCFALLAVLRRLDVALGERLRLLGDVSFTIFFAHGYALFAVQVAYARFPGGDVPGNLAAWLLLTAGTIAVTTGGAALVRRLAGKRSRYLIGS